MRDQPVDRVGAHALLQLELFKLRNMKAGARHHRVGARFVHAERRREHTRAGVRKGEQLEHSLHGAVLAQPAVKRVEHASEVAVAQNVPGVHIEVDAGDVVTPLAQRLLHLRARAQRHLALG